MQFVLLALVVVAVGVILTERDAAASSSARSTTTRTIYLRVPGAPAVPSSAGAPGTPTPPVAPSAAPQPPAKAAPASPGKATNPLNLIGDVAAKQVAPFAPQAATTTLGKASELLAGERPSLPAFAAPVNAVPSGLASRAPVFDVTNPLGAASQGLGTVANLTQQVNPAAPAIGLSVFEASKGFRGQSKEVQSGKLGQLALSGLQTVESLIPFAGTPLAALTGVGAQTYEGKRAVKEAGRVGDQGYEFDKKLFSANTFTRDPLAAFSGGGKDHQTRVGEFFNAVNERVGQLASGKGGALTPGDVAAINQARSYGLRTVWSNGKPGSKIVNLSAVNLTAGTNPFAGG